MVESWPDAHVEALRELITTGLSARQIGRRLFEAFPDVVRSRNAVVGKCHRLGLGTTGTQKCIGPHLPRAKKKRVRRKPTFTPPRGPVYKPPAPPAEEVTPKHLDLLDCTHNSCRWPYGDNPFTFCGHRRMFQPDIVRERRTYYCTYHYEQSFRPRKH
jgi:hypothetical protein